MSKKVADQLVETLHEAGVKRIYAVTGDSLNEVNDAVRRAGNIKWMHVRHEETGAFAAGAEAALTGIGCCAGSSGPGHVHLINGLYDAHRSNLPVVAIASTCGTTEFGTSYFQETDPGKLFSDCSGYNHTAMTAAQFPRMLHGALQHVVSRKEVAVVGLPGDVAAQDAEGAVSSVVPFYTQSNTVPDAQSLMRFADLVNSSGKVTVFCGVGAGEAHDQVVEFAGKIKAPVAYSFKSKMMIQYENPYEVGITGLLGLPPAYESMNNCDLLIMLGTDFPYTSFLPEDCKIIQVDIRPERLGRRTKIDLGIAGDVKSTLLAVMPMVDNKTDGSFLSEQLESYHKQMELTEKVVAKKGRKENIAPEFVTSLIDKYATKDAIFTVDTGMCCVWGARYLTATGGRTMLGSFNHGTMANAMPQAIGAAMACPDRQIIALCGDGGLSMLLGDLATIVQYKLPIKLIVFNNRALGMVKLEMEVAGLPDNQTDMYNPDFALIAQAMGMEGYRIDDPENVEQSLIKVLASEGPALIEVLTDPNSLALPPHIEFSQMKGFAEAMARMVLTGRTGEVWDTVRANLKHVGEII